MIPLSFSISPDRRTLTVIADDAARAALLEMQRERDDFYSDSALADAFEHMLCNSELSWVAPERHGDLTDAPILGIQNPNWSEETDAFEEYSLERWGYMDYALKSPLADLIIEGRAVFVAP